MSGYYGWPPRSPQPPQNSQYQQQQYPQAPPPLPPRSPQPLQHQQYSQPPPPVSYGQPYYPQYGNLPPPPPGPPPSQSYGGLSPGPGQAMPPPPPGPPPVSSPHSYGPPSPAPGRSDAPPPVPARPAGYEVQVPPTNNSSQHAPAPVNAVPQAPHANSPYEPAQTHLSSPPPPPPPAQVANPSPAASPVAGAYPYTASSPQPSSQGPATSSSWTSPAGNMSSLEQGMGGLSMSEPPPITGASISSPSELPTYAVPDTAYSAQSQNIQKPGGNTIEPSHPPLEGGYPLQANQGTDSHESQPAPDHRLSPLPQGAPQPSNPPHTPVSPQASASPADNQLQRQAPPISSAPAHADNTRRVGGSRPVTACIDTLVTFGTTWYTHPSAPAFQICSRCYVDHIERTVFRNEFTGTFRNDKKARICHFSKPTMKDVLFPAAVHSRSLQRVTDWMRLRATIPDCKGEAGAKGTEGIKWYNLVRPDDLPGFCICEACYQDLALSNSLAANFQPHPGEHLDKDVWSCDLAVPYIKRTYLEFGKVNDLAKFLVEAGARLQVPACPKLEFINGYGRAWFRPISRSPPDFAICAACYLDRIAMTVDDPNWCRDKGMEKNTDVKVMCDMAPFNVLTAALRADELDNWSIFWNAAHEIVGKHPHCNAKGIENATWYTLPSKPKDFCVCGACMAGLIHPLGISRFFVPLRDSVPADTPILCSMHPSYVRFPTMIQKVLETYWLDDPSSLDRYARDFAYLPVCGRDEEFKGRAWYGWDECTICAECYVDFIRGTALEHKMTLKGVQIAASRVCEMYSPRMRNLYLEACASGKTDELLQFSAHRRSIYYQTVPQMRMMLFQAKLSAQRTQMLNITSSLYMSMGGMVSASQAYHTHDYGNSTIGYAYDNVYSAQGAMQNVQARNSFMNGQAQISQFMLAISQMEPMWKAVE